MVEKYLELNGVATVSAENGKAGLTALREHSPSLVLLDLSMPVMDGWRFREEQQRLPDPHLASVPVVLLSAHTDLAQHASALGAVDVLPKPIDLDRLIDVVRRYAA